MWKYEGNLEGLPATQEIALEKALEGVRADRMTSRGHAAALLHEVAHHGEHGGWNPSVTPEDLGRAVSRLLPNCPGLSTQEILGRMMMGMFHQNPD